MTVDKYISAQIAGTRKTVRDDYGKLRQIHFEVAGPTVAGDALSTADLAELPFGTIRILPHLSKIWGDAFGAARVLDIGHRAYTKEGGIDEVEDLDALAVGLDVSAATADLKFASTRKFDIFSRKGVTVSAQVRGGTWPIGAKLSGYIAIIVE